MLDKQGRLTLGTELLLKTNIKTDNKVNIFFDRKEKSLMILSCEDQRITTMYFVATHTIDKKSRVFIPDQVRKAFPNATYLPVEKDGDIYILIIEHERKPE